MASSGGAIKSADDLTRVSVAVPSERAEPLRGALSDVAPRGWAELDGPDGVEFTIWVAVGDDAMRQGLMRAVRDCAPTARVVEEPETSDWRDGLRAHHHPVEIGGRIRIRPPWVEPIRGFLDIEIDPGMAFGTGQHSTTRGCLELLLEVPVGSVLDVGCGSGILAIAARKLGHDPVWAVDFDPLAVDATLTNAAVNGVELEVALAETGRDPMPSSDTVIANITERYVAPLIAQLPAPGPGHAILSGFRPADVSLAIGPWVAAGYVLRRQRDADDWTAVLLERE